MLDDKQFDTKPNNHEVVGVVSRIVKNPVEVNLRTLAIRIEDGCSIIPAYLGNKVNGVIRKTKDCWSSQQLIFLDIDNEKEVPDPLPDKPNNKKKVKDVHMTIEQALEEFRDTASFIYKSFSYTDSHPKFRIVFALNRLIHNRSEIQSIFTFFKTKYPFIDSKCLEESRLFFGGTEVIEVDYDNVLLVDEMIEMMEVKEGDIITNISNNVPPFYPPPQTSTDNIVKYIIDRDIKYIQPYVEQMNISVSRAELYKCLYRINFASLLGVSEDHHHCCLFHEDNTPSAVVNINENTGEYLYRCYGCEFTGNIVNTIEKLFFDNGIKIKRGETIEFLRSIYNIDIKLNEWGEKQKLELEANIDFLLSNEINEFAPELHKLIAKSIPNLVTLHNIAIQNISNEEMSDTEGNSLFFKDIRSLSQAFGRGSKDKTQKDIGLYAYLGVLNKLKPEDIPKKYKLSVSEFQHTNKYKYKHTFYSIPSYTYNIRDYAEQKAKEWKEKGYVKSQLTREMILRGHGEEEANRVYPQMVGEKIPEKNEETARLLAKIGLQIIDEKGWTTEKEIEDGLKFKWKGQAQYKQGIMKRMRSEFFDSYGLKKSKLNKELAKQLNIEIKKNDKGNPVYPQIIHRTL